MDHLWTWGGTYFGYRDGEDLWTYDGHHVGRFDADEVYGPDGRYMGERRNENRLITAASKLGRRGTSFSPLAQRVGQVPYVGYVGYVMYAGFQDFPAPNELA
jgi:hypothetical protein